MHECPPVIEMLTKYKEHIRWYRKQFSRPRCMLRKIIAWLGTFGCMLIWSRSFTNIYSLSHKTVNAKENFWNVYCFAANQTRDETAKDDRQAAAGISHDLIRNNELAVFLLQEIFNIPFGSLWKSYFLTTNQHQSLDSICSKTKLPE